MMRRSLALILLAVVLSGCGNPNRFELAAEPMMEAAVERVAEPATGVARKPDGVAGPATRPKARPSGIDRCKPGDDGIGGTGCPVD